MNIRATILALSLACRGLPAQPVHHSVRLNVIVTMQEGTNAVLEQVPVKFATRSKKIKNLKDRLEGHSRRSQTSVIDLLSMSDDMYDRSESFWLTNQIVVYNATWKLVKRLRRLSSVMDVSPESVFPLFNPVQVDTASDPTSFDSSNWNIAQIGAPKIWSSGYTGADVVVGSIDTGVRASHQALRSAFRSTHNWYDPETKSSTPYDATGHGTHVMGIIAGNNGIGVAPDVKWITCKGCRSSGCVVSDLLACFQFMLCPTKWDGTGKDCSKAPDVVNNSWGAGQGITTFNSVINAWRSAGIIPVFASGNTGPSCGSVVSPGDNTNVITVGATDMNDQLGSYSGKGPTSKGAIKPDLVAPGSSITSSCFKSDAEFCVKSGTSMSTPHVSGAIALYLSKFPNATYASVRSIFQKTTVTASVSASSSCSDGSAYPNNNFGFGRLNLSF